MTTTRQHPTPRSLLTSVASSYERAYKQAKVERGTPPIRLASYGANLAAASWGIEGDVAAARLWLRVAAAHAAEACTPRRRLDGRGYRTAVVLGALGGDRELCAACVRRRAPSGALSGACAGAALLARALAGDLAVADTVRYWQGQHAGRHVDEQVRAVNAALPELALAALLGDRDDLEEAAGRRDRAFVELARHASVRTSPQSLVDFDGLAWLATARHLGRDLPATRAYLPTELIGNLT